MSNSSSSVLIIVSGLSGILNASFKLSKLLKEAGCQCTIATPKKVEDLVKANGFNYLQMPEILQDPSPVLPEFRGPLRKLKRIFYKYIHYRERRRKSLQRISTNQIVKSAKEINPQLILIDCELHEYIIVLKAKGFSVSLLSQWFSIWKAKGLPPITSGIIPGTSFWGSRLGIWCKWMLIDIKRLWIFKKRQLISGGTDRRSILLLLAKKQKFDRSYFGGNYWPGPFVYTGLPVLLMVFEELEFPHKKPMNHCYVGAMVDENRIENVDLNTQAKLEVILKEKSNKNKRLIYCTLSTMKSGDIHFVNKVIDAVVRNDDWLLVISLGGAEKAEIINPQATNVYILEKVPQLKMLQHADLSINHGGIHTINECLHFGVPMLIYSGKKSDQNGCAARLKYHHYAEIGDKDKESADVISLKIKTALLDAEKRIIRNVVTGHDLLAQLTNTAHEQD